MEDLNSWEQIMLLFVEEILGLKNELQKFKETNNLKLKADTKEEDDYITLVSLKEMKLICFCMEGLLISKEVKLLRSTNFISQKKDERN